MRPGNTGDDSAHDVRAGATHHCFVPGPMGLCCLVLGNEGDEDPDPPSKIYVRQVVNWAMYFGVLFVVLCCCCFFFAKQALDRKSVV